jgi:hypothetical protein
LISPLELALSAQLRLRRTHGPRAYDEARRVVRLECDQADTTPRAITDTVRSLLAAPAKNDGPHR